MAGARVNTLEEWAVAVCRELELPEIAGRPAVDVVLDVARDVAHGVARPAAPLTAYLLGVAVGRAEPAALGDLAARVSRLAENWPQSDGGTATTTGSDQTATLRGDMPAERRDQERP
jgi:Domain of unknown function (DUF6457)